ncbi:unnamed protein product, partial [Rotaria sp. Silwood1]
MDFLDVSGLTTVIVIGRVSFMIIVNGLVLIIISDIYHDGGTVLIIDTIDKSIVDLSTKKSFFLFVASLIGTIYEPLH